MLNWPQDIAACGRLVGIEYFLSAAAWAEEKTDSKTLRKAKLEEDELRKARVEERKLRKEKSRDQGIIEEEERTLEEEEERALEKEGDPDLFPHKAEKRRISLRMQKQFGDFTIQRKACSLRPDGRPLIELPKLETVEAHIDLTPRELDDLDHCTGSESWKE